MYFQEDLGFLSGNFWRK